MNNHLLDILEEETARKKARKNGKTWAFNFIGASESNVEMFNLTDN